MLTLENANGVAVTLTEMGGAIQSILTPDRQGRLADIVLGYDSEGEYPGHSCFGAFVGRYANRIAGASFPLGGKRCRLTANEGPNTLHGGHGYHLRPWQLEKTDKGALLRISDPDGEEGFPGNLELSVEVTLSEDNELRFRYHAVCDKDTVVNFTNHSYFNLSGKETILDHELRLDSDRYLEIGPGLIPTGKLVDVTGTDFDFRQLRPIASGKYDHCFVLSGGDGIQAEVWDPDSGRGFTMKTSEPAVQLYCGGGLGGVMGKGGRIYAPFAGFCLETQHYPDAPNHPEFPSTLLKAGEGFCSETSYRFFTK